MNSKTGLKMFSTWKTLLLLLVAVGLVGCGDSTFSGDQEVLPDPTIPVVDAVYISSTVNRVNSAGDDYAEITAQVVDANSGPIEGVEVVFSATDGFVMPSKILTDSQGKATIQFSAGSDPANVTASIKAVSGGISSLPLTINIVGSTVTLTATTTNLVIGDVDTATLTVTALDSLGNGVANTDVTVLIDGTISNPGSANLSIPGGLGVTDTVGEFKVDLTGTAPGPVRIEATALNETVVLDFTVTELAGSLLITAPTSGTAAKLNTSTQIDIAVPAGITDLTLVSSVGLWDSSGNMVHTLTGITGPTTISENITSQYVGTASVSVTDTNNTQVNDYIQLTFVDTNIDSTSKIDLQAEPASIPQAIVGTSSTTESTSALQATVSTAGNPIANARVVFAITNSTGSGEYINPPVAYTDANGVATATLYAGTTSTDNFGLHITASLDESLTLPTLVSAAVDVTVGGTPGSIDMGASTKISVIDSDTGYSLPISLQVLDSVGNPVANTVVTLTTWPERYALGYWACYPTTGIVRERKLPNEDINRDLVLDLNPLSNEDTSGDGLMTPVNSAGGSVPKSVLTNELGRATFNLTYNKQNAGFIYSSINASTLVQGTETLASLKMWLPALESDIDNCYLGDSPFNNGWPRVEAEVPVGTIVSPLTSVVVTVTLFAQDGITPLEGKTVEGSILLAGSDYGTAPILSDAFLVTDAAGQVRFTYTAGNSTSLRDTLDLMKFTYTLNTSEGDVVIADYVWLDVIK